MNDTSEGATYGQGHRRGAGCIGDRVLPISVDLDLAQQVAGQPMSATAPLPHDEWPLRGVPLRCLACRRWMVPARWVDEAGTRVYSCGPGCRQRDLIAEEIEDHLLLGALIRGAKVVYRCGDADPPITAEELDRWRATDVFDRRAVLAAAFVWVDLTPDGRAWPVWRRDGARASELAGATR